MVLDVRVVVDVEPCLPPLGVREGLHRQPLQRRMVEPLEQLSPARAIDAHPPVVQLLEQLGDPLVQRIE